MSWPGAAMNPSNDIVTWYSTLLISAAPSAVAPSAPGG